MGDDRDAALALYPLDQGRATARDYDVDNAAHLEHVANGVAVTRRYQLYRMFRQAGGPKTLDKRRNQSPRGMEALRAAAQDRGISRFEGQSAGIGGHIRAALINDPDDPQRHADPCYAETIGPGPFVKHPADRIGLGGDVFEATRDRFESLRVVREQVE